MTTLNNEHCCNLDQSIQSDKSIFAIWLNGAISTFSTLIKSMKNRRAVTPLLYASDRELADMGLTPADVNFIRNKGMFSDPSAELQRRAHYRSRDMNI
jgi:uncharacterized protein YjiS (DUF1127 family)